MRRFLLLAVLAAWGCESGPRVQRIDLTLRNSCDDLYDVTCLESIEVKVIGDDGKVDSACTPVAGMYETIKEAATGEVLTVLEDIEARSAVIVEFRGYHGLSGQQPCSSLVEDDLLIWGASEIVDLGDRTQQAVRIDIECRADCDCAGLTNATPQCSESLVRGSCTRGDRQFCRSTCQSDAGCVGSVPCASSTCTPATGGLCFDCETLGRAACDSGGICVQNTDPTSEYFCTLPCPQTGQAAPCPNGMSCKPLGGIYQDIP